MSSDPTHKIILDSDGGVDDAMALYFALAHPQLELLGIATTFGNVSTAQALSNAIYLCALAGRSVPVHEGVHTPTRKAPVRPDVLVHGADGLGNLPTRLATSYAPDTRSSARFIVEMAHAHPGQITLVVTGPMGNLYQALRLEPHLPELLRAVIVSGGSILAPGNVTPVAEANIWHDPHAADIIFTAGFALSMVGLDVGQRMVMPLSLFEGLAAQHRHPATDTLLHAARFYAGYCGQIQPELAHPAACFGHDVLPLMLLLHPDRFDTQQGRVRVVPDGLAAGQTIMNRQPHLAYATDDWDADIPMARVCLQVDAAACLGLFEQTLRQDWLPR